MRIRTNVCILYQYACTHFYTPICQLAIKRISLPREIFMTLIEFLKAVIVIVVSLSS